MAAHQLGYSKDPRHQTPDTSRPAARQPNILIIQPDQHAYQVMGCAGNPDALTPNLDTLAQQSAFFDQCVATSPVCCPWRASMQSGLYWHSHGVPGNNIRLDPSLDCIANVLGRSGYDTGYIGKWHLDGGIPKESPGGYIPRGPRRQGWQEWYGYQKSHEFLEVWKYDELQNQVRLPEYDWEPTWHTDMALDFIQRKESANTPWCYYLAYGPPHKPEQCPQEYLDKFDPASFQLNPHQRRQNPDEASLRELLQIYYAQVNAVDFEVGRLLQGLKNLGISENTIVMYVSDHGDFLGTHGKLRGKSSPFAPSFRVPLMIHWPGQIAPQQTDTLIGAPDLPATLLDLAGIDLPDTWQGKSYATLCRGGHQDTPEAALLGLRDWTGVWDGRHVYSEGSIACIYDHLNDPYEMENRFSEKKLNHRLRDLLVETARTTGLTLA